MQEPNKDNPAHGILYAITAFGLLAIMAAFAKLLHEADYHVVAIAFYRNILFVIPLGLYIAARGQYHYFKTSRPIMMLIRAVLGTITLILTYKALSMLPLSDATMLFFSSVLFTPMLAFFFLKEHVGIHRWAAIIFGLLGVTLIVGPSGYIPLWGGIVALTTGFMHAIVHVILRNLKTESSVTVTFYFTLGASVICGAFMPFIGKIPTGNEWLYIIGVAASGGLSQIFLTSAYRLSPAALIAPFNFTGLLWTTTFDILIWSIIPGWPVFAGAGIILAAQSYIIYRERKRKNSTEAVIHSP